MDEIDRKLLARLRVNARLPVSSLAHELGISRATVQNRIDKMLANGTIEGFSVKLKSDISPLPIRAITLIQTHAKQTTAVLKDVAGLPAIHSVYTTNGQWDLIVEINTQTLEDFDETLTHIRDIDGVANTETSLLLTAHK